MKYFIDVVNFVSDNLIWILIGFFAVSLIELVVFLVKNKGYEKNWDDYYIMVMTNIIVILALYVAACLCVGFVNCLKDQDWNFWSNYIEFLGSSTGTTIIGFVFVIAAIIGWIKFGFGLFGALIAGILGTIAAGIIGFVGYVIVAIVWVILRLIWFIITGFFESIAQFVSEYWKLALTAMITPGLVYGMVRSFINYCQSLKEEVFK